MARRRGYIDLNYPFSSVCERELPVAKDVEDCVLSAILNGQRLDEIFSALDESCFAGSSERTLVFRESKELYDLTGFVPINVLCGKLKIDEKELLANYGYQGVFDHLEYYIKILVQYKFRRAAARESFRILSMALDDCYVDDLIDSCRTFLDRLPAEFRECETVREPEKRSVANDWYVFSGDTKLRHKVLPGRDGRPDYCRVDGRNVSEKTMLRNGFKRVSLENE